ncbi:MAG TPA: carboxypeptidase regulatory-like domain-containing protein, partial [Vicinamibacterales bacterium]
IAQVHTGRIDISVFDLTGAVLPAATVDISGPEAQTETTDSRGEAHFLNLSPGTYTVRAKLSGFSDYLNRHVDVRTGASVPLRISMTVQGVATQVQVTSETPVTDARRVTTATNLTLSDLQDIPSARDPWVMLQTVPTVIIDRVNVGGAESGQQSSYLAKGAQISDNTWSIDGIPITDMAATGSTPTYYDFDMLQETEIVTGGADVQSVTPGIQLNLVLKSGSDQMRGSTRLYFENESLQANNLSGDLASTIGGTTGEGNRTHQYYDFGGELGGPLVKGRLWAWGAAGKTHVDLLTLNGAHDRTELQNDSLKATGQITQAIRANFTYFRGSKEKFGRGAAPNRAPETTYDQTGPTDLFKGEATYAGRHLFVAAKAAHVSAGFSLTPVGGLNQSVWEDDGGIYHGSFDFFTTRRPQNSVAVDANTFLGRHELKFGLSWRRTEVQSTDSYPGTGIITYHVGYPEMLGQVTRESALLAYGNYSGAYVSDSWSRDRLTLSFGLRWDRQASSLGATSVPAAKTFPQLLPGVTAAPVNDAIVWNSVTPRIGATWSQGKDRQTVVRAAYSIFAAQLGAATASFISPIQAASITFPAIDLNGNKLADPNELDTSTIAGFAGFDPANPTRLNTVNHIGSYTTPVTHEVVVGADHELWPHFGVGGALTYRHMTHFNWTPLIGVTAADYVQTATLTDSVDPIGSFSVPVYALLRSAQPAGNGQVYEQRLGYRQRYLGLEVNAVKRMSDRWMARFGFSTNDHREYFDGTAGMQDPTPSPLSPNMSGGLVLTETSGSGKSNIYMVLPSYQFIFTGLYQWKWGINVAANVLFRQGYAEPFFQSAVSTGHSAATVLEFKDVLVVNTVGDFRLPMVKSVDGRLEKTFAVHHANIAASLDVFNVPNAGTPLGKTYDLRLTGPTGFNQILEIMNPLIVRLGARVTF